METRLIIGHALVVFKAGFCLIDDLVSIPFVPAGVIAPKRPERVFEGGEAGSSVIETGVIDKCITGIFYC